MPFDEILRDYPDLEREDILEALRFAASAVRERELPLTLILFTRALWGRPPLLPAF